MEDIKKAISDLEYCIARYGKENTFTFAAYKALNQMKVMQSRIADLEKDAARSRWLKNKGRYNDFRVEQEKAGWVTTHSANSLDEAIDTAMQKD